MEALYKNKFWRILTIFFVEVVGALEVESEI